MTEETQRKIQDLNEQIIARQTAHIKCLENLCEEILKNYTNLYEAVFGNDKK